MDYKKLIDKMKKLRMANPLRTGIYKLDENYGWFSSWCREVDNIAAYNSKTGNHRYAFMHCTHEDWHIWLRALPKNIIELLTYNILPAIDALAGDGVPTSKIEEIRNQQVPKIEAIRSGPTCLDSE